MWPACIKSRVPPEIPGGNCFEQRQTMKTFGRATQPAAEHLLMKEKTVRKQSEILRKEAADYC